MSGRVLLQTLRSMRVRLLAVVVAGAEIQIKLRHIHQESVFNDGAASVASGPAALVGFAAGFYWTVRRGRRKATAA